MTKILFKPLLALALAVAAASGPANALTVSSSAANGNLIDTTFTSGNQIGVDISFLGTAGAAVTFAREPGDSATATFNAIIRQLIGSLDQVFLSLDSGARFLVYGSVATLEGAAALPAATPGDDHALIALVPATTEIYLGDPFLSGAPVLDWSVDLSAVRDTFTLSVRTVGEPGGIALLLAALAAAAATRRRRA